MTRPTLPEAMLSTLQAAAEGYEVSEIAARLHLAEITVRHRLSKLYRLLGARNRAHAVSIGYRLGVLDAHPVAQPGCVLAVGVPVDVLVAAREDAGVSQQQMAARLGRSPSWLSHRETGRRLFPMRELREYARIVGVDLGAPEPAAVAA